VRHQSSRTAETLTLLAILCVLVGAMTTSVASATPAAREQREQQREARRQSRLHEREARRAAREAQRTASKAQREDLKAQRTAERAARSDARSRASDTVTLGQPTQGEGAEGAGKVEGTSKGEGETQGGKTPASPTAAPHGTCTLSASATPTQASTGEAVTLAGTLSCPTTVDAGEQTVTVTAHERGSGTGASTNVGTASTANDGSFQIHTAALTVTTVFTLQTPAARHPFRVVVPVGAALSLQGPKESGATLPMSASREAGGPAPQIFTGTIHPEQANRMVALWVRYGTSEWRKVAYTRTNDEGRFSFTHKFNFAGDVSVMATAHPHGTAQAESVPLTYAIAPVTALTTVAPATVTPAPVTPVTPVTPTPVTPAAPTS
jgi:hypothetical protein